MEWRGRMLSLYRGVGFRRSCGNGVCGQHVCTAPIFNFASCANRSAPMVQRICRHVWIAAGDPDGRTIYLRLASVCSGRLHRCRVLVYSVDLLRESCRGHRTLVERHFRRNPPGGRSRISRCAIGRGFDSGPRFRLAQLSTERCLSSAGFILCRLVLASSNPHRLKPALPKPSSNRTLNVRPPDAILAP